MVVHQETENVQATNSRLYDLVVVVVVVNMNDPIPDWFKYGRFYLVLKLEVLYDVL
jgi:hypothetical protein